MLKCLGSGAGQASLGTVLSSAWASLALLGVSAVVGLLVCLLPDSPSLGLLDTPQMGYLVIVPIFQHIQVEQGGRFTW